MPPAPAAAPAESESFDLDDVAATRPPFGAFERLRARGPVQYLPRHQCWIAIGHDAVRTALAAPRLFSSEPEADVDAVLLGADPPDHTAVRRLVSACLANASSAGFADRVAAEASALITDRFDLVKNFAIPLARRAGALIVGLEERELGAVLAAPDAVRPAAEIAGSSRALLVRARIWRHLVAEADGLIDEDQACSLVRLLCRASTETTQRLIVRAAAVLLRDETLRRRVEEEPALLATFIEEMMRLYPPEPNVVRRTTREVALGGVVIPAGASVLLSLLGANRDPAVFPDPGEVRLNRARAPHLSFGGGPHQCVGADLGRRVALLALQALLDPARRVEASEPPDRLCSAVEQGIETARRLMLTAEPCRLVSRAAV